MSKFLCSTGLWPVVSGVTPETSCDQFRLTVADYRDFSLRAKSGAPPDLTGVTPVLHVVKIGLLIIRRISRR
jgi:hypothetical protein